MTNSRKKMKIAKRRVANNSVAKETFQVLVRDKEKAGEQYDPLHLADIALAV